MAEGMTVLIHGDAPGADTLAREWAEEVGMITAAFPADWEKHGRAAGPIRNKQMIEEGKPDRVIAFPGGPGTKNMIYQAGQAGIPVWRFPDQPPPTE